MWMLPVLSVALIALLIKWRRSGQRLHDFLGHGLVYVYARIWHRCSYRRPAPLPRSGPAILYSNHTSSTDPAFLDAGCARPLSFFLAREYYNIPWLRWLFDYLGCVPVTRNGRDVRGVRQALRRLQEGRVLCIFPEGGLSYAGRNRLGQGKVGIALLALRSRAPIFPARIQGGPQTSALLPAWLRPAGATRVTFGPAVDLSAFQGRPINRKLLEDVTALCMRRIVELESTNSKSVTRHPKQIQMIEEQISKRRN